MPVLSDRLSTKRLAAIVTLSAMTYPALSLGNGIHQFQDGTLTQPDLINSNFNRILELLGSAGAGQIFNQAYWRSVTGNSGNNSTATVSCELPTDTLVHASCQYSSVSTSYNFVKYTDANTQSHTCKISCGSGCPTLTATAHVYCYRDGAIE